MNDTSRDYVKALRKLLDWIENDTEWQRWWAHAPVAVLEVYYWFDNGKPGVRVRRAASKVTASITRSAAEQGRGAEGRDQARQDVLALIGRLRTRLDLPEPPPLPSPGARSRPVNLAHDPGARPHLPRL